jgi:tRNA dimethylallyltransferase
MSYRYESPAIFILGPSAVGKTSLSLELARQFPIEVVSVDSAMVFKGMDIGTCKPTASEQKIVNHHLIDVIEPDKTFNAGIFLEHVEQSLEKIVKNKKIPLFVGGSMMFHKLLLEGIHDFPTDKGIRIEIDEMKKNNGQKGLVEELKEVDPETYNTIDIKNSRRVERALEIIKITKTKLSELKRQPSRKILNKDHCLLLGLSGSKEILDTNAEDRIKKIIKEGFLEELENLVNSYKLTSVSHSMNSINYKQFLPHLNGSIPLDEACNDALQATKKLIKTQLTWMKKFELNYVKNTSDQNDSNLFSDTINTYLRSLNK